MLHKSDKARCVKILQYIHDIQIISSRHGNEASAFNDVEGRHAIMMCLLQIGELVNRITDEELQNSLESRKIVAFRNIVAHEYDALDVNRTIDIIRTKIPEMRKEIMSILSSEDDFHELEKLWQKDM